MEELHDIIAVGAGTSSKIVHQEDHQVDRIENLKRYKANTLHELMRSFIEKN